MNNIKLKHPAKVERSLIETCCRWVGYPFSPGDSPFYRENGDPGPHFLGKKNGDLFSGSHFTLTPVHSTGSLHIIRFVFMCSYCEIMTD